MTSSRPLLTALALSFAFAAPAGAQTVIFSDDAEGDPAAKWVIGTPPEGAEPWQKSDSSTQKFRGNQAKGGATSYWTGVSPTNWPLVPTTAGPGTVIEGEDTLTIKEPFVIPADGDTNAKYWSLFQNEGDDSGNFEVAVVPSAGGKLTWRKVKGEAVLDASAGSSDPRACDPSNPATQQVPFEEQTASLATFKGASVFIRFNLLYGAENRPASHPCGWYIDDIRVLTTGTLGNTGTAGGGGGGAGGGAGGGGTAPAKPAVKFGKLKLSGKKATLSLTVSGSAINKVTATLAKGSKKLSTAKAATLAPGARKVTFKLKKKLKKGSYKVTIKGTASDGSAFTASGKAKG